MISFSIVNLKDLNSFSTSNDYLQNIEENIKCDFPEESFILFKKNGEVLTDNRNIKIIGEGVIRFPSNDESKKYINDTLQWNDNIDDTVQQYFSVAFYNQISNFEK